MQCNIQKTNSTARLRPRCFWSAGNTSRSFSGIWQKNHSTIWSCSAWFQKRHPKCCRSSYMIWRNAGCCTGKSSRISHPGRCIPSLHLGVASFPYWMPCAIGARAFWTGWTSHHHAAQKNQQENLDWLSCWFFITGSGSQNFLPLYLLPQYGIAFLWFAGASRTSVYFLYHTTAIIFQSLKMQATAFPSPISIALLLRIFLFALSGISSNTLYCPS